MQTGTSITPFENGQVFTDDFKIANIFYDFFINITDSLELNINTTHIRPNVRVDGPFEIAIDKYHSQPSIHMIKKRKNYKGNLVFHKVSLTDVFDQVQKLCTKKFHLGIVYLQI